jgi:hypothetical protein
MTTFGCCNIGSWPSRRALQEARNTTEDHLISFKVHQYQHLCRGSIYDENIERLWQRVKDWRFLAMLPLHHNTSTTKRMLWMSKIEAVASTELSCQHLPGRTEDKEGCLTANRRYMPLGTSETRNRTCTDIAPCTGRILTYTVFRQL